MRRREFIALVAGAAASWPFAVSGQQATMPVIRFLSFLSRDKVADRLAAFGEGLREAGYVDGKNVTIEFRSADGHYDQFPSMAAELGCGLIKPEP